MNKKITKKRNIGDLGEKIAINFMKNKGFSLIEQNYLKPFGEIDLILKKSKKIYFIEVKTGKITSNFNPMENLTNEKIRKFEKIVEYYIKEKKLEKIKVFYWAILVYLDIDNKTAKVKLLKELW